MVRAGKPVHNPVCYALWAAGASFLLATFSGSTFQSQLFVNQETCLFTCIVVEIKQQLFLVDTSFLRLSPDSEDNKGLGYITGSCYTTPPSPFRPPPPPSLMLDSLFSGSMIRNKRCFSFSVFINSYSFLLVESTFEQVLWQNQTKMFLQMCICSWSWP